MLRLDMSFPADHGAMLLLLLARVDADSLLGCGASLVDLLGTLIFCISERHKRYESWCMTSQ